MPSKKHDHSDPIWDAHWECQPPLDALKESTLDKHFVLYQLLGRHPTGARSLLYIGRTVDTKRRLKQHWSWARKEPDVVEVRVASLGTFESWEKWNTDKRMHYASADTDMVKMAEKLLIFTHQPPYNSSGLQKLSSSNHYRLFNTGRFGPLCPELSTRRWEDFELPPNGTD